MYSLIVKESFDAAHFLENYTGKCAKIHGHTWHVEVELLGKDLDKTGMLIDFGEVKKRIRGLLPDHEFLNDILPINPTAENLARYFFEKFRDEFREKHVKVKSVTIWESLSCGCRYEEAEGEGI